MHWLLCAQASIAGEVSRCSIGIIASSPDFVLATAGLTALHDVLAIKSTEVCCLMTLKCAAAPSVCSLSYSTLLVAVCCVNTYALVWLRVPIALQFLKGVVSTLGDAPAGASFLAELCRVLLRADSAAAVVIACCNAVARLAAITTGEHKVPCPPIRFRVPWFLGLALPHPPCVLYCFTSHAKSA